MTVDEKIIPMCGRVLIRRDEDRTTTRGGIVLPAESEIPQLTGRVVEIAKDVENNDDYADLRKYDKVLYDPRKAIPVDLEGDNKLYLIPIRDVLAVVSKSNG